MCIPTCRNHAKTRKNINATKVLLKTRRCAGAMLTFVGTVSEEGAINNGQACADAEPLDDVTLRDHGP